MEGGDFYRLRGNCLKRIFLQVAVTIFHNSKCFGVLIKNCAGSSNRFVQERRY